MRLPYDARAAGQRPQPFSHTQRATAAAGSASVSFTPELGQTWHVELVTVTSLSYKVTVARDDGQVIDSTSGDPRPTVTSDSAYELRPGETLVITWATSPSAALANGTIVTATVTGHWTG